MELEPSTIEDQNPIKMWYVRDRSNTIDEPAFYDKNPNFFTLKIHHGGRFEKGRGRKMIYEGGKLDFVDMIGYDVFNVAELNEMLETLGYVDDQPRWTHFKLPNKSLDDGLLSVVNDDVARILVSSVTECKVIEVYVEHCRTHVSTVPNSPVNEGVGSDGSDGMYEQDNGEGEDNDEEGTEYESDSEGSDFIVDKDNRINEVEVDMNNYKFFVDNDVEWIGSKKPQDEEDNAVEVTDGMELDLAVNLEAFESGDEEDECGPRRSVLKKIAEQQVNPEFKAHFFVGQTLATKDEIKEMVRMHAVETRRQIHFTKNDHKRVRAICRGTTPIFSNPNAKIDKLGVQTEKYSGSEIVGSQLIGSQLSKKAKTKKGKAKKVGPEVGPEVGKSLEGNTLVKCSQGGSKWVGGKAIDIQGSPKKWTRNALRKVVGHIKCPWVIYFSKSHKEETWVVKTYNSEHKCLPSRVVKKCTAGFLAKDIEDHVLPDAEVPVKAIKDILQKKYEQDVSRQKIYRARVMAKAKVSGDYVQQYSLLRNYILELKKTNPGTTVKLDFEQPSSPDSQERQFKRIYVCLDALKRGFKVCGRELLGLDGCFMKGGFQGQILTAVGIDANNGTYPVAYAIVEAETLDSWKWFLDCVGDDLDLNRMSNFTFISDRQKGLIPALAATFPCAEHRYCLRHIYDNMKGTFRGEVYKKMIWHCASATTVGQFDAGMTVLRKFNNKAYEWLKKIPAQHWTRSHFSGRSHCDILLNNICEVFNRRLVDGRDKPIISCLEYIREYLMKRIVIVQSEIEKHDGPLTPNATNLFQHVKKEAAKMKAQWNGGNQFQVTGQANDQCVVDMHAKTCTCRKWELTGIPCKHAVAAMWDMAVNGVEVGIPESYVNSCYWLTTWKTMYSYKIGGVNGMSHWPNSTSPVTILPPKHRVQAGRPKKSRRKTAEELSAKMVAGKKLSKVGGVMTCGICKGVGHSRRGCKQKGQASIRTRSAKTNEKSGGNQSAKTSGKGKRKAADVV